VRAGLLLKVAVMMRGEASETKLSEALALGLSRKPTPPTVVLMEQSCHGDTQCSYILSTSKRTLQRPRSSLFNAIAGYLHPD